MSKEHSTEAQKSEALQRTLDYLRTLAARFRGLFGSRRAERELEDEIETHLRLLAERYVRQGLTEAEDALAARRQFGNVTLLLDARHEESAL